MEDNMHKGTPWLDEPVMLHSSREYKCKLNFTEQCEYQQGYWRFWYEADHRYALPTVAFFLATIVFFGIGSLLMEFSTSKMLQRKANRRLIALARYLSYRSMRINALNWNTAPVGVLLLGAVGTVFFFCMTLAPRPYYWPNTHTLSYGNSPPLATRTGWMSLACMPFVFATAGKSNWITMATGVSHEKLQVFHRWISYAMYVLALIHTFPFIVFHIWKGDMVESWNTDVTYWTGAVALIAQSWLTFASFGPLRNLWYEFFKLSHFVAALCFMLFFFFHCDFRLSSWDYFIATGVLFSLSWLHRQLRIYVEYGIRHTATLSLASNGFVRVAVPTDGIWTAGQHYFVRFFTLGLHTWTIHPFTACSLPNPKDSEKGTKSELVFYVRPRGGFTARLATFTEKQPNARMRVLLDGPYGGVDMRQIASCQRMLLIAGGSGAGWLLPMIIAYQRRSLLNSKDGAVMRVVLATRDMPTQYWFEEAVSELLGGSNREGWPPGLTVEMHYTGNEQMQTSSKVTGQFLRKLEDPEKAPDAKVATEVPSDSESDTKEKSAGFTHGLARPNLPALVKREVEQTGPEDKVGVFVCGPLSMQNDVANAVAWCELRAVKDGLKDVYLHMEHFSWA